MAYILTAFRNCELTSPAGVQIEIELSEPAKAAVMAAVSTAAQTEGEEMFFIHMPVLRAVKETGELCSLDGKPSLAIDVRLGRSVLCCYLRDAGSMYFDPAELLAQLSA